MAIISKGLNRLTELSVLPLDSIITSTMLTLRSNSVNK